jgi:diacylglycerol kinase family enzyme
MERVPGTLWCVPPSTRCVKRVSLWRYGARGSEATLKRFAQEAVVDGVDVLVAGGGDRTLHEMVNGLMTARAVFAAIGGIVIRTHE